MNILFWNLCKHQNVKVIQELFDENEVDVALFCEYTETGVNNLVKSLGTNYFRIIGFGGCKKITMLARKPSISSAIIRREQARFAIYLHSAAPGGHGCGVRTATGRSQNGQLAAANGHLISGGNNHCEMLRCSLQQSI